MWPEPRSPPTCDGALTRVFGSSTFPTHRCQLWSCAAGKSDNQNHAIVFSRGTVIQAIDANQEGYLEESLKLCNALQEFEPNGPAIVGFREHIFSGLGALGDFAAGSEAVFGSLVQNVMAGLLYSRYHYGHPDLMDKMAMIAQGGISKVRRRTPSVSHTSPFPVLPALLCDRAP